MGAIFYVLQIRLQKSKLDIPKSASIDLAKGPCCSILEQYIKKVALTLLGRCLSQEIKKLTSNTRETLH